MKLTKKFETLLLMAVKQAGSYDPEQALSFVEEHMTVNESQSATAFLGWVQKTGKTFGHGNIGQRFKEWQAETRSR